MWVWNWAKIWMEWSFSLLIIEKAHLIQTNCGRQYANCDLLAFVYKTLQLYAQSNCHKLGKFSGGKIWVEQKIRILWQPSMNSTAASSVLFLMTLCTFSKYTFMAVSILNSNLSLPDDIYTWLIGESLQGRMMITEAEVLLHRRRSPLQFIGSNNRWKRSLRLLGSRSSHQNLFRN